MLDLFIVCAKQYKEQTFIAVLFHQSQFEANIDTHVINSVNALKDIVRYHSCPFYLPKIFGGVANQISIF